MTASPDLLARLAALPTECWLPGYAKLLVEHGETHVRIERRMCYTLWLDEPECVEVLFDLALGVLDVWLEDNGWHVIRQKCGRWCICRMMEHGLEPHGEPQYSSRLEAAIAAAEIAAEEKP